MNGTSLLLKRRAEPEIMRNSSAVRKLPPDDKKGTEANPHEVEWKPDELGETTAEPWSQRLRKPPEYLGFEKRHLHSRE